MKRDVKVISGLSLFLALSLASCESAKVPVKETEYAQAPALVVCRDGGFCDWNPEHLESFVANFYKWCEANDIVFFSFPRELSSEARLERVRARKKDAVIRESTTSAYYRWMTTYSSDKPTPAPQNCPSGTSAMSCFRASDEEWLNATARLVELDGDGALIIASLPFHAHGSKAFFALDLPVRLKIEGGAWRIDGVCCPETAKLVAD